MKQGLEGGKKTASLLKQAIEGELKSLAPSEAHHIQVIIRVYANVKGLAKTYKEMDILPEGDLETFVRGFNMGHVMCDYTDAGNGKECSDEKIKGQAAHCQANVLNADLTSTFPAQCDRRPLSASFFRWLGR